MDPGLQGYTSVALANALRRKIEQTRTRVNGRALRPLDSQVRQDLTDVNGHLKILTGSVKAASADIGDPTAQVRLASHDPTKAQQTRRARQHAIAFLNSTTDFAAPDEPPVRGSTEHVMTSGLLRAGENFSLSEIRSFMGDQDGKEAWTAAEVFQKLRLARLQQDCILSQERQDKTHETIAAERQSRIDHLQNLLEERNSEMTDTRELLRTVQESMVTSSRDNERLSNDNGKLRTDNDSLRAGHEDLRAKHEALCNNHKDLSTKHADLGRGHERLRTEYEALRTKHDTTLQVQAATQTTLNVTEQERDKSLDILYRSVGEPDILETATVFRETLNDSAQGPEGVDDHNAIWLPPDATAWDLAMFDIAEVKECLTDNVARRALLHACAGRKFEPILKMIECLLTIAPPYASCEIYLTALPRALVSRAKRYTAAKNARPDANIDPNNRSDNDPDAATPDAAPDMLALAALRSIELLIRLKSKITSREVLDMCQVIKDLVQPDNLLLAAILTWVQRAATELGMTTTLLHELQTLVQPDHGKRVISEKQARKSTGRSIVASNRAALLLVDAESRTIEWHSWDDLSLEFDHKTLEEVFTFARSRRFNVDGQMTLPVRMPFAVQVTAWTLRWMKTHTMPTPSTEPPGQLLLDLLASKYRLPHNRL